MYCRAAAMLSTRSIRRIAVLMAGILPGLRCGVTELELERCRFADDGPAFQEYAVAVEFGIVLTKTTRENEPCQCSDGSC